MFNKSFCKGFTLFEMILIIVLLSVIASIASSRVDISTDREIITLEENAAQIILDFRRLKLANIMKKEGICTLFRSSSLDFITYNINGSNCESNLGFNSRLDMSLNFPVEISIPESNCEEIVISSNSNQLKISLYPTGYAKIGACNE